MPGGIDAHTHFDLPAGDTVTADDFASGTKAAIFGGTTTIIDYATQFKGETLADGLVNWQAKADGRCYCDYGFHMAITDWQAGTAREMADMVQNRGISSFKLYMAYKNSLQVDDGVLLAALMQAKQCGALIALHCENGDVVHTLAAKYLAAGKTAPAYHALSRPLAAEAEATNRAVALAEIAQAPLYVVHLTNGRALQVIAEAKLRGVEVYAETCPQYLLLDESYYRRAGFEGAKYVISPPLRPAENQTLLWDGLRIGVLDTVGTDHCSFNYRGQKEAGIDDFSKIPNGMPGVENRIALLYTYGVLTGRLNLNQLVAVTATRPAQLFGLFPRKGTIAPGSDADIVVWNPQESMVISAQTQVSRGDYAPYEGFQQVGQATHVFLRGRQVVAGGKLKDTTPGGVYLFRQPFVPRRQLKNFV